jgi:hypothetical protein
MKPPFAFIASFVDGSLRRTGVICAMLCVKRSRLVHFVVRHGAILLMVPSVLAHAPFDGSARVIVHEDSAEVMVTVGSSLGENYLRLAQINPAQLPSGHPFPLNADMATNFFALGAEAKMLVPREADVVTDGLEFQFHFDCALTPAKTLRLETFFTAALKPPRAAPLVMTDENGNIFGSAILSPDKPAAEFALPEKLFPQNSIALVAPVVTNSPTQKSTALVAAPPSQPGFGEFLKLGVGHILNFEAFDHLLFLTALLLGCPRLKPMLLVITGFTLAHSLTLALAALNIVTISPRIVEPAIAASIIFVAAENFRREEKPWHRYALTCGFGLIHGFGFVGALRASGLGGNGAEIAMPLFAFNLGVEIGQLAVAAVVLPLLLVLRRWPWFERQGARVISALVILVAMFWLWQRITSSGD